MEEFTAYMWSVTDWRNDDIYKLLSTEERGAYRELIDECWINGSIPKDHLLLARMCGLSDAAFKQVWPLLQPKFENCRDNSKRLVSRRLEKDRKRLDDIRIRRTRAAKSGAAARWQTHAIGNADAMAKNAQTQTQTTDSEEEKKKQQSLALLLRNGFEQLWQRYPVKDGRKDAERHFAASVTTEQDLTDCIAALSYYLEHIAKNDWKRAKNGKTWFNNWRDWIHWQEPPGRTVTQDDKAAAEKRHRDTYGDRLR